MYKLHPLLESFTCLNLLILKHLIIQCSIIYVDFTFYDIHNRQEHINKTDDNVQS